MQQVGQRARRRHSCSKAACARPASACASPAQLIDGKDGGHLWADRYDRDLTDIFAIQDEITHTIVDQLKVKLLPEEKKAIEQAPTENVEAYTYYLRGREFFHRAHQVFLPARAADVRQAVELDPTMRAPMPASPIAILPLPALQVPNRDRGLFATCAKALALDPSLAEAHASHGLAL